MTADAARARAQEDDTMEQPATTAPATTTDQGDLEHDEHGHDWGSDVERVEHGFAPLLDPGNPKGREQREAEARAEAGDDANAPILTNGRPLTSEEEAARYQRLRSLPSAPVVPVKGVIVNGVAIIVKAGADADGADVPPEVREVLENEARPLRTSQAQGLGNGLTTYDLTSDTATNPPGSPSEAIAAAGVPAEPEPEPAPPAPAPAPAPAPPKPRPPGT